MRRLAGLILALCGTALRADLVTCQCDPAKTETMPARQCGLCREAEKQATDQTVFFLKDINPAKAHRWLALPRSHAHSFEALSPGERAALWTGAIAKANELYPEGSWGLATNGRAVVTQCHTHIHIGKLLAGIETKNFLTVSGPEDIPVPVNEGFWIHPAGGKLHVHRGEQVTETVLLR